VLQVKVVGLPGVPQSSQDAARAGADDGCGLALVRGACTDEAAGPAEEGMTAHTAAQAGMGMGPVTTTEHSS
jgi:hypothetical protein